jgi:hypothetical protein
MSDLRERIALAIEARAASYCLANEETLNPEILGYSEGRISARIYELRAAAQIARDFPVDPHPEEPKTHGIGSAVIGENILMGSCAVIGDDGKFRKARAGERPQGWSARDLVAGQTVEWDMGTGRLGNVEHKI